MLLNQPQSKLGQTYANSKRKIDGHADSGHAKALGNFVQCSPLWSVQVT